MERRNLLLKQGAEAKIYSRVYNGSHCIVKERFSKAYRHPNLDKALTSRRIKAEVRALMRCRLHDISVPSVYFVDQPAGCIYMEGIKESRSVREYIEEAQSSKENLEDLLKPLANKIGGILGKMHHHNIIHGDLTTSNMLVQGNMENFKLFLIDFGLSDIENSAEDKGVDLYVLERAILSSHPNTDSFFEDILTAYKSANKAGARAVMDKLEEVRLRGRKRTMVG